MATYFGFALIFFVLVMGRIFTHNDVQKERLTIVKLSEIKNPVVRFFVGIGL